MDETNVSCEFGQRLKVFGSSATHHGGFVSSSATSGSGTHVTAVIAVSASGRKSSPFFIVAGKQVMSAWFDPLSKEEFANHKLTALNWFPEDGVVKVTENGSMTREILPALMKQLHKFVSKFLPTGMFYLLCLDGHKSRLGIYGLRYVKKNHCEIVQSPANTSHFLQPCDQYVNRTFQRSVRKLKDEVSGTAIMNTKSVKFKLMCGVKGTTV